MRIAYLDCFAGASGDMFLGALIDAGVPLEIMVGAVSALQLPASLKVETVDRSGISSAKVHVLEVGHPAEGNSRTHTQSDHTHSHTEHKAGEQSAERGQSSWSSKTQHLHRAGDSHTHEHDGHEHGRSLSEIQQLIGNVAIAAPVKMMVLRAFDLLGHSEAKIHDVPVEKIHFHEVGAVDAIVDIVAACAGIHYLQIDRWYCSPLNVGGGTVECAHGRFPVPAPAVSDLLVGVPTYSAHVQQELVTPTGAALVRVLDPTFGPQPPMRMQKIGYGAGTRDPHGFPNVLRLQLGESVEVEQRSSSAVVQSHGEQGTVAVLETALDDLSPQLIAYVAEGVLSRGALDVMLTPVIMKKGRPGTLLTVLCNPAQSRDLEIFILRETSSLGIRIRYDQRLCLERSHIPVETHYGTIRMKVGMLGTEEFNAAPEFEDCRKAATEHHVAVKLVQQAAIAAYTHSKE